MRSTWKGWSRSTGPTSGGAPSSATGHRGATATGGRCTCGTTTERWRRKQKYVIDDREAWETDRDLIDGLLSSDPTDGRTDAFPTSDYLTIGRGETVYRSDGWWKAVVEIVGKGSYDTQEVAVYVWQAGETDDDWRRRQKYVAKARGWTDDVEAIQRSLGGEDEAPTADDASAGGAGGTDGDTLGALEDAIIDF